MPDPSNAPEMMAPLLPASASPEPSAGAAAIGFAALTRSLSLEAGPFSATQGQLLIRTTQALFTLDRATSANPGADGSLVLEWPGLRALMRWDADRAMMLELTNTDTQHPVLVQDIVVRFAPGGFASLATAPAYSQVLHSRDATLDTGRSGVKLLAVPTPWSKEIAPPSYLYTLYQHVDTRDALLLGALPPFGSSYTIFQTVHESAHGHGRWGLEIRYECAQQLNPGASLKTSPVVVRQARVTPDAEPLMSAYAHLMRQRLARPRKPQTRGWNSWDYYQGAVQRSDMDENTVAARRLFGDRLRYIVIDEGYECMWGVWQGNWKFPQGLADYCRFVKNQGYQPGIWCAPLMVNTYTPLYRAHPDWFTSNADGSPLWMDLSYGTMAHLDITHPQVRTHLRSVYERFVADGFTYFKCDFTQLTLKAQRFHDPAVGRADLIRLLFQLIRDCIGDDRYLLSCLAPYESVIGIADAHRITNDIHHYWSHVRNNIINMFQRLWMQGTIGNADPDFAIVRSPQTSADPLLRRRTAVRPLSMEGFWCQGPDMTLEEARMLGLAIHLTGGEMVLSDALAQLNDLGVGVLRHLLDAPPVAGRARLLNLLTPGAELTPVVCAPTAEGYLLGLFNLKDHPHEQELEGTVAGRWTNFWTDQPLPNLREQRWRLPPHTAQAFHIKL